MGKTFVIKDGDISDGYHTFDELYEHRCLLFLMICLTFRFKAIWKPHYEGWFCLYWESPVGQISYHLPNKLLPFVEGRIERDDNYKWDGHTSNDTIERLIKIAEAQLKY